VCFIAGGNDALRSEESGSLLPELLRDPPQSKGQWKRTDAAANKMVWYSPGPAASLSTRNWPKATAHLTYDAGASLVNGLRTGAPVSPETGYTNE